MIISLFKLQQNPDMLKKYIDRECKLFNTKRNCFILNKDNCTRIETVDFWDCEYHYDIDLGFELHFVNPILGDSVKIDLKDCQDEDIYNNVNVKFDKFTSSLLGKINR